MPVGTRTSPTAFSTKRRLRDHQTARSCNFNSMPTSRSGHVAIHRHPVGEAFRALIPSSAVQATYGIATLYALGDAVDKGYREYKSSYDEEGNPTQKRIGFNVTEQVVDTALWQLLASVSIPAVIVNRACKATSWGLSRSPYPLLRHPSVTRWGPTTVGLSLIPVMPHIVDKPVDMFLDNTTRRITHAIKRRAEKHDEEEDQSNQIPTSDQVPATRKQAF